LNNVGAEANIRYRIQEVPLHELEKHMQNLETVYAEAFSKEKDNAVLPQQWEKLIYKRRN
jgi:hypothetical protein